MIYSIVTILITIISFILSLFFENSCIFFVSCMSVVCLMSILKMNLSKELKVFLVVAFVVRIIFVIIDLYYYRLPDSGSDDDGFYRVAMMMKENTLPMSVNIHGGLYSIILCLMSFVIGENRLGLQFTNVILFCVSINYLNKTLDLIGVSSKTKKIVLLIISFEPYIMFSNSILRRDTLISTLLIISLYHFIKWYKCNIKVSIVVSVMCVVVASLLHTAAIFTLPFYFVFYLFYNRKKEKCIFFGVNTIKQILLIVIVAVFGSYFLTNYSTKISKFDSIDNLYSSINTISTKAGSTYLANININSISKLILYTPLKTFYFLYSPMPWDFRGIVDILAFVCDSCVYLFLTIKVLMHKKVHNTSIIRTLFVIALVFIIIFSLGTSTSGTAIRHRYNVLPYLLVLFALNEANGKKGVYKNEQ